MADTSDIESHIALLQKLRDQTVIQENWAYERHPLTRLNSANKQEPIIVTLKNKDGTSSGYSVWTDSTKKGAFYLMDQRALNNEFYNRTPAKPDTPDGQAISIHYTGKMVYQNLSLDPSDPKYQIPEDQVKRVYFKPDTGEIVGGKDYNRAFHHYWTGADPKSGKDDVEVSSGEAENLKIFHEAKREKNPKVGEFPISPDGKGVLRQVMTGLFPKGLTEDGNISESDVKSAIRMRDYQLVSQTTVEYSEDSKKKQGAEPILIKYIEQGNLALRGSVAPLVTIDAEAVLASTSVSIGVPQTSIVSAPAARSESSENVDPYQKFLKSLGDVGSAEGKSRWASDKNLEAHMYGIFMRDLDGYLLKDPLAQKPFTQEKIMNAIASFPEQGREIAVKVIDKIKSAQDRSVQAQQQSNVADSNTGRTSQVQGGTHKMADEKFIKELQDTVKAGAGTSKGPFAANPAQEKQMYDQFMQQLRASLGSDPGADKPGVQSSVRNMMATFPQQRNEIAAFVLDKIKNPDASVALAQRTPNTTAPPVHTPPPRPRSEVNVMDAARSGNPANPTPEARAASQRFQAGLNEGEITRELQKKINAATPQVQAQANRILESLKNTSDERIDGAALAAIDKISNPDGKNKDVAERNLSQATNSIMAAWKQDPAKVEQSLRQQMQTGSPSERERANNILDVLKTGGSQTETKLRDALKVDGADVSASEVRTLAKATLLEKMQSNLSPSALADQLSKIDTTTMIQGAMDRYTQRYNNQLLSLNVQAAVDASQKASYDEAARIARDAIIQSSGEEGFKKACDNNNGKNPVLTQACAMKP